MDRISTLLIFNRGVTAEAAAAALQPLVDAGLLEAHVMPEGAWEAHRRGENPQPVPFRIERFREDSPPVWYVP